MSDGSGELVLASASSTRAALLQGAGLDFCTIAADLDEAALRRTLLKHNAPPEEIALALAEAKGKLVSARRPEAAVVAADQILWLAGEVLAKPADLAVARRQLLRLRGRHHDLVNGLCLVRDGQVVWRHSDRVALTMRDFSEAFLDAYLAAAGETVLSSVGGYRLEGPGAQLFKTIEGDYFSVLGLPLLALLDFLRDDGVIAS
ncbi:MAG TPA: Maf family nucleotide pyrophosphatase [Alphaproteobacteria bacterium]|nr:Maf family nucleotide pyrophosphatase [Alphaproteobacteria bacterium]